MSKIRPLAKPILFYSDRSGESQDVRVLFYQKGVWYEEVPDKTVEEHQRTPLVLFQTGIYQGISEIRELTELLEQWSERGRAVGVFRDQLHLRLLYLGKKEDSREAERILQAACVEFVPLHVPDRRRDGIEDVKPPCLIVREGRFSGLDAIERYVRSIPEMTVT